MFEPIAQPFDSTQVQTRPQVPVSQPISTRLPSRIRSALKDHLDTLASHLGGESPTDDGRSAARTLDAIASILRAEADRMGGDDYRGILRRLVAIYAAGAARRGCSTYLVAAASYADVVGLICGECPACDFDEAVGQMLVFMNRLFRARDGNWRAIYKTILAIPDSAHAKQFLLTAYFPRLKEWHDSGVANLFSIEDDLNQEIAELASQVAKLDKAIAATRRQLEGVSRSLPDAGACPVISLNARRHQASLARFARDREALREKIEVSRTIVELIESDIQEFEGFIRETRRAYFIRSA